MNSGTCPPCFLIYPTSTMSLPCCGTTAGHCIFFGGPGIGIHPFRWSSSNDSGATWDPIKLPALTGTVGSYSPQPINSAFRGSDGTIYVSSDGFESTSLLWASRDNGKTWIDTGGRTGARHSTFAFLKDGGILGPEARTRRSMVSCPSPFRPDGGKTWTISQSALPALAGSQRPALLRLQSGRLFFASDFQTQKGGKQPTGFTERGAFVALSEDEGRTWKIRKLTDALSHERSGDSRRGGSPQTLAVLCHAGLFGSAPGSQWLDPPDHQ